MTKEKSPPYMRMYPTDELARTMMLDLEVIGIYYRLRCHMWISGGRLEDNEKILSRAAGIHVNKWRKLLPKLQGLLTKYTDGTISIIGVVEEYEKATHKREVLSENGGKGGRPKKETKGAETLEGDKANGLEEEKPNGFENEKQNDSTVASGLPKPLSSSPSPLPNKNKKDDVDRRHVDKQRPPGAQENFKSLGSLLHRHSDESLFAVRQIFHEFLLPLPPDWHLVSNWLENGAELERDILPVLQQICSRVSSKGINPPKSFAYFQEAITRQVHKNIEF